MVVADVEAETDVAVVVVSVVVASSPDADAFADNEVESTEADVVAMADLYCCT